ncbi:hypothetical protein GCM10023205_00960 [Yinghuangia aomiensis]|uniref:Protein kinase domain-containing protein n=1 Tax=Yinghuangia aomiensis TaxID=676205 RepID=A0ABP9GIU1_9ACTN
MIHALRPGDPHEVGGYRVVARLGAGGMGEVFLGRSPSGRLVAIKLVRAELSVDPDFRARFRREVDASRRVSAFHTAAVVAADADATPAWMVTEYIPGPSLEEAVRGHGPFPGHALRVLGAGLAEALEAIHACDLIHRDLKPSNILLAEDGPRVIDFGIARALEGATMTRTGFMVGSVGFLSPEQLQAERITPAADVFALGAVLCAAAGIAPFGEGSAQAMLYRVVHQEPNLGGLPDELHAVVTACLAKDPEDRPQPMDLVHMLSTGPAGQWLPLGVLASIRERRDHAGLLARQAMASGGNAAGQSRPGVAPGAGAAGGAAAGGGALAGGPAGAAAGAAGAAAAASSGTPSSAAGSAPAASSRGNADGPRAPDSAVPPTSGPGVAPASLYGPPPGASSVPRPDPNPWAPHGGLTGPTSSTPGSAAPTPGYPPQQSPFDAAEAPGTPNTPQAAPVQPPMPPPPAPGQPAPQTPWQAQHAQQPPHPAGGYGPPPTPASSGFEGWPPPSGPAAAGSPGVPDRPGPPVPAPAPGPVGPPGSGQGAPGTPGAPAPGMPGFPPGQGQSPSPAPGSPAGGPNLAQPANPGSATPPGSPGSPGSAHASPPGPGALSAYPPPVPHPNSSANPAYPQPGAPGAAWPAPAPTPPIPRTTPPPPPTAPPVVGMPTPPPPSPQSAGPNPGPGLPPPGAPAYIPQGPGPSPHAHPHAQAQPHPHPQPPAWQQGYAPSPAPDSPGRLDRLPGGRKVWLPVAVVTALAVLAGAGVAIAAAFSGNGGGKGTGNTGASSGPLVPVVPPTTPGTPAPKRGGSIVVAVSADSISLDPATAELAAYADGQRMSALYDPLVVFTQASGTVTPQLAKSLTTTDGALWTLELRPNVTFSDGTPLDAAAVKFNWERLADPTLLSPHAQTLKGVTLTVVDPTHLTIQLAAPDRAFDHVVADELAYVGSPTAMKADSKGFGKKPVGAGPYVLKSWDTTSQVFARNPTYWQGADKAYLDGITFKVLTPEVATAALNAGQADVAFTSSGRDTSRAQAVGLDLIPVVGPGAVMMAFNDATAPFDDVRARKAVIAALDADQVGKALQAQTTDSVVPDASPLASSAPRQGKQDHAKAQALFDELAAAGKPLSFTLSGSQSQLAAFQVIQNQLAAYQNVTFKYEVLDSSAWVEKYSKRTFQALWGWEGGTDLDIWLRGVTQSGAPANYLGYKDADVDAGWTLLRNASTPADRQAAYMRIFKALDAAPPWWIMGQLSVTAVQKKGALNGLDGAYADGIVRWELVSKS